MGNPTKIVGFEPKPGKYRLVSPRCRGREHKYEVRCACGCGSSTQVFATSSQGVPAKLREERWRMTGKSNGALWWPSFHAPIGAK